jgi:biotin synthase
MIRHNWTLEELNTLYELPLLELISKANAVLAEYHRPGEVQMCSIINIKTGGCSEDCKYCSQSSRYKTPVTATPMMKYDDVIRDAKIAIAFGATRICLGAAWRELRDNKHFDEILKMIKGITDLGAEVCCSLGMLEEHHAKKMKDAGLYAYNHNLDSSEKFYKTIITTRTYQDRLNTLDVVEKAGISVCCGGILGLGETIEDRLELLLTLSKLTPHPDSIPLNRLSGVPGTPLQDRTSIPIWEFVRIIAIARIIMPKALIRLSVGRIELSYESQALCFLAGANSIHIGKKLLTLGNPTVDKDEEMFKLLGIKKRAAFAHER